MTRITAPPPPISSEPPSWTSAISSAIFDGTSSIYDFLKRQLTYPLTPLDPERVSAPKKESNPSFLDSVKKGVSSITKKQCVTAVALVAIGYAYTQLPNVDQVTGRLFGPTEEPSTPKPQTDWTQTLTLIFTALLGVQNILQSNREALLLDRMSVLMQETNRAVQHIEAAPTWKAQLLQELKETIDPNFKISLVSRMAEINQKIENLELFFEALKEVVLQNTATTNALCSRLMKLNLPRSPLNGRGSMCTPFSPKDSNPPF